VPAAARLIDLGVERHVASVAQLDRQQRSGHPKGPGRTAHDRAEQLFAVRLRDLLVRRGIVNGGQSPRDGQGHVLARQALFPDLQDAEGAAQVPRRAAQLGKRGEDEYRRPIGRRDPPQLPDEGEPVCLGQR
jgi:hypothetical protein